MYHAHSDFSNLEHRYIYTSKLDCAGYTYSYVRNFTRAMSSERTLIEGNRTGTTLNQEYTVTAFSYLSCRVRGERPSYSTFSWSVIP